MSAKQEAGFAERFPGGGNQGALMAHLRPDMRPPTGWTRANKPVAAGHGPTPMLYGQELIGASHAPIYAAARWLLDNGVAGLVTLLARSGMASGGTGADPDRRVYRDAWPTTQFQVNPDFS